MRSVLHIAVATGISLLIHGTVDAAGEVRLGLALFSFIAWLWITEALPISVTALLVPLGASLLGLSGVRDSLANFASPVIYLFMGGFALAAALQKYELDRAFAHRVLAMSRGHAPVAVLLLFLVTACLSMWISNTATVAMMLPIAAGLLSGHDRERDGRLFLFVLLGLAYAGNIGGMATLIGSPPNAIAASAVSLSFRDWLGFGLPAFFILFPTMIVLLYLLVRPPLDTRLELEEHELTADPKRPLVIVIFVLTALGWVMSSPLSTLFGVTGGFDSLIALAAIVALVATGCLTFSEFTEKTSWDILILFGGGLTLSSIMQSSGASAWLADGIVALLPADHPWLMLLVICLFVVFLTELVSNTASAALLVPLFMSVAPGFGLSQEMVAVLIALCASCAFMLPVATPPNALVFSTGCVPQRSMMRIGFCLNVAFSLLLSGYVYLLSA